MKALLVIMDGLGDRTDKTPLNLANTPCLDLFAKKGITGLLYPIGIGFIPGSDTAHLAILGYDPFVFYKGRGAFEALGAGFELGDGDVAFRVNMATVDENLNVLDRRSGRNDYGMKDLFSAIDNMEIDGVKIRVTHTVEHRGAALFSGKNLSVKVSNTDPHRENSKVEKANALDSSGEHIAKVLNEFTKRAFEILKRHPVNQERQAKGIKVANIPLLRGPGECFRPEPFEKRFGVKPVCVAGGALYKGVARYLSFFTPDIEGATGTKNTNLVAKKNAVLRYMQEYDFVFAHLKGTDSCGHDGDFEGKKAFIERADREFFEGLLDKFDVVVVTGDHSTPCIAKRHSMDPVPILFYHKDIRPDETTKLCEAQAYKGGLGRILGKDLVPIIMDYINKSNMFGE